MDGILSGMFVQIKPRSSVFRPDGFLQTDDVINPYELLRQDGECFRIGLEGIDGGTGSDHHFRKTPHIGAAVHGDIFF